MLNVLMVDDDPDLLCLAKSVLMQVHGIEVELARTAEEALIKLRQQGRDAIIMDHELSDMGALEVLELLRMSGEDLPFIVLLPKQGGEMAAEAFDSGASFCLRKSGDPTLLMNELGNMVKVAVQMRQAEMALLSGDPSFWSLISHSKDMILIVDANATTCHLNQAGADMLCLAERDMVGSSVMKAFHSEDVPSVTRAISDCVASPGRPVRVQLRGRSRGRTYLPLEGEAVSAEGRTVIFYLMEMSVQSNLPTEMDSVLWRDLTMESRDQRQRDLTKEMTFRLISRMLVDRMSENEAAVAQNRFRAMSGLAGSRGQEEQQDLGLIATSADDGDVMSQFIDRLAVRIDLMEIDGDAKRVERANRRFYGPD